MDMCKGWIGKRPGGRRRGMEQGRLEDQEPGMSKPQPRVRDCLLDLSMLEALSLFRNPPIWTFFDSFYTTY